MFRTRCAEITAISKRCLDTKEVARNSFNQKPIQTKEGGPSAFEVDFFEKRSIFTKKWSACIVMAKDFKVILLPSSIWNSHVANQSLGVMSHRDGQPQKPVFCRDTVSIAPISCRVLDIRIKHEQINIVDEVKIALPGDVVGLIHGNFHRNPFCPQQEAIMPGTADGTNEWQAMVPIFNMWMNGGTLLRFNVLIGWYSLGNAYSGWSGQ